MDTLYVILCFVGIAIIVGLFVWNDKFRDWAQTCHQHRCWYDRYSSPRYFDDQGEWSTCADDNCRQPILISPRSNNHGNSQEV